MRPKGQIFRAAAIGVLSGFLAGLFGVGGGVLIVPALVLLLRQDQRHAHGTSLAAIVPIAVLGVVAYAMADSINWAAAAIIAGGAAVGALAGTQALRRLPQRALRLAFSAFLVATAIIMSLDYGTTNVGSRMDLVSVVGLALVGLAAGMMAGLLGVGGGLVTVPAMVLLFSMSVAVAKGTSLAVIVPTAVVGTIRNIGARNVDLGLAAVIGLTGMASSYAASRVSVAMDARLSNILFACLLLAVAVILMLARDQRR